MKQKPRDPIICKSQRIILSLDYNSPLIKFIQSAEICDDPELEREVKFIREELRKLEA